MEERENVVNTLFSERGNVHVIFNNFKFKPYRVVKGTGERGWRCCGRNSKCKVKLYTVSSKNLFSRVEGEHDHNPVEYATINRATISNAVKRNVDILNERPSKLICKEIVKTPSTLNTLTRYDMRLIRNNIIATRLKSLGLPKLPKSSDELQLALNKIEIKTTNEVEFLLTNDIDKGFVVFSTETNLKYLCKQETFLIDGTLEYAPKDFQQVVTIHSYDKGSYVPLVFSLLKDKKKDIYVNILESIQRECERRDLVFKPKTIVIDCESVVHENIKATFPAVNIVGCWYLLPQVSKSEEMGSAKATGPLLQKLRALMKSGMYYAEPLQAYIVPQNDPHNSEYLATNYERRAFLSGFTGSAGTAVITEKGAYLWTDGRYFLQASKEMDDNWTLMKEGVASTPKLEEWLTRNLPLGSRIGVDPQLVSIGDWRTWCAELHNANHLLLPVSTNLIDLLWDDRPAPQSGLVLPHPLQYSGKSSAKKVCEVRAKMEEKNAAVFIVTALDDIAWLLNLRGSDIPYNPVFYAYVIITTSQINMFVDSQKVTPAVLGHFKSEGIDITLHPYEKVFTFLEELVNNRSPDQKFWITHTTSYSVGSLVPEAARISEPSPITEMKAVKNPVETEGLINCHIRDGAALVSYLAWLEKELNKGSVVTEISGASKLEDFRKQQEDFVGLSFPTISSSGLHGAVIHYKPTPESDKPITTKEMYLCDSGAQYKDGTTDITRTVHFGTPTQFQKECFTRVLKGHIALATVKFPAKIKGNCLDSLARLSLWSVGLEYMHGTGHGIGAYLNVHEGPMGISWRPYPDDPGLQEGMFLSNEPGYYEDGEFGIRIEDIQRIVPAVTQYKKKEFLTFDVVSLAPIQKKLLEPKLLTNEEIDWLNGYHSRVREKLTPVLKEFSNKEAIEWLHNETEPIG